jgi:hypothetical protein
LARGTGIIGRDLVATCRQKSEIDLPFGRLAMLVSTSLAIERTVCVTRFV